MSMVVRFRIIPGLVGVIVAAMAVPLLHAQDYYVLSSGERRNVTITRVDDQNLYYQTPGGDVPQPWRTIKDFGLTERPGVRQALAAVEAGNAVTAVPVLKPIANNYMAAAASKERWIGEAVVALVRAYTELKQFADADAVAGKFGKVRGADANRVKSYQAIALAGVGKFDEAITLLSNVVKVGESKLAVTAQEGRMLGQAYLALGDCYAGKHEDQKALENYLSTVVLYYHDDKLMKEALAKADELKKKLHPQAAAASTPAVPALAAAPAVKK